MYRCNEGNGSSVKNAKGRSQQGFNLNAATRILGMVGFSRYNELDWWPHACNSTHDNSRCSDNFLHTAALEQAVGLRRNLGHKMLRIISESHENRAWLGGDGVECSFALEAVFAVVEEAEGFVDVAIQI